MDPASPIDRELAAAEKAWLKGNQGKARVCARRAVVLAGEEWLTRHSRAPWHGDEMAYLRRIQFEDSLPLCARQAAERLTTPVPRRDSSPFTIDPIGDGRVIIAHLTGHTLDKT
jgi:hypothetical protein